ncbi:MAG: hypothetical protein V5A38_06810 [Halolamina sp.]
MVQSRPGGNDGQARTAEGHRLQDRGIDCVAESSYSVEILGK